MDNEQSPFDGLHLGLSSTSKSKGGIHPKVPDIATSGLDGRLQVAILHP